MARNRWLVGLALLLAACGDDGIAASGGVGNDAAHVADVDGAAEPTADSDSGDVVAVDAGGVAMDAAPDVAAVDSVVLDVAPPDVGAPDAAVLDVGAADSASVVDAAGAVDAGGQDVGPVGVDAGDVGLPDVAQMDVLADGGPADDVLESDAQAVDVLDEDALPDGGPIDAAVDDGGAGDTSVWDVPEDVATLADVPASDDIADGTTLDAQEDAAVDAGNPPAGLCSTYESAPWSRKIPEAGGTVTFTEIMYHPAGPKALEWVELHNPMTVDMDVSGWRLDGGVQLTFPEGTFIAGGGYLVVAGDPGLLLEQTGFASALGPWDGQLSNGGEELLLVSNGGRLMDAMEYDDSEPWPVTPDGSGASLAKIEPTAPSGPAESWAGSAEVQGTPGKRNFPDPFAPPTEATLVPAGALWRYEASGSDPGPGWREVGYDDSGWGEGEAPFFAGADSGETLTAKLSVTADNHFAVYAGKADGSDLTLVGADSDGNWQTVEVMDLTVSTGDHLFLAAWEAPGDSGSPQMVIGQVVLPDGSTLVTSAKDFEAILGPAGANPGGWLAGPPPGVDVLAALIGQADVDGAWAAPLAEAPKSASPWGGAVGGAFAGPAQFVWPDTFSANSVTNVQETYALFRSVAPVIPPAGATEVPLGATTTWFRVEVDFEGVPALTDLWLEAGVDDGAIFYLDGVEVHRQNMPEGPVSAQTPASEPIDGPPPVLGVALPGSVLAPGPNVLAVEVHQAVEGDGDMAFGATLTAKMWPAVAEPPLEGLGFSEVAAGDAPPFWVELRNGGTAPLELVGVMVASSSGASATLSPQSLAPGAVLALDEGALGFGASVSDKLFLYAPGGAAVLDGLEVAASPRARAEGSDTWLTPDVTTAGASNAVVLHDEVVLNEIMFHHAPLDTATGPAESEEEWVELHNRSAAPVDLGGWQLVDAVKYVFAEGVTLPPGGFLVVARDAASFQANHPGVAVVGDFAGRLDNSGETLALRDACGNPVDEVRYYDGGRWPGLADGGGSSLELRDPWADNAVPEAWAASDESGGGTWQTFSYEGVAAPSAVGPDGQWQELVVGLLDAGVVLLDDISVVEDPGGEAKELIEDGTFEAGAPVGWRLLGTHRHSEVVVDPADSGNHALRLVATGMAGHMHNHAETTLAGGASVTNGKHYAISFRARWVSGSNQLNTRLYFNRLAKTTLHERPAQTGTPGAVNSRFVDNVGPTFQGVRHTPAVPAPFEPVFVTAEAADPDGVVGMVLWTSVDGGPFEGEEMIPEAGGRFVAVLPGHAPSTVVQLTVEAEDSLGATSVFPAGGASSRALWKVDDGLAATNGLHNVRIIMTPDDADWLHATVNLMSDDRVGATVIYDEREVFYDVGVRLKGSERGRPQPARLGFGLFFHAEQPFRGVHRSVMVDRSEGVGYGQREMLINEVMTHAGSVSGEYNDLIQVIAPRVQHTGPAELQLARFGSSFLDAQFDGGSDGTLFEYELVYFPTTTDDGTPTGLKLPQPDQVVGTGIHSLGDDKEAYRHTFMIENNRWRDDYQRLMDVAGVLGLSGDAFHEQVGDAIDVDQWLRAFAFGTLSGCVDNYAAGSQHNAQLYVRPGDQRVLYFPHDLDFFGGSPNSAVVGNGDLKKLIADPAKARAYYGHLRDIIETTYNGTYMSHWRDHFSALLPGQSFGAHHAFIVARSAYVLSDAPDSVMKAIPPVPFEITTNGGQPVEVAQEVVTLEGTGWVDVREILLAGADAPLAVAWVGKSAWQATVGLECGSNELVLTARGFHGEVLGQDSIVVTRDNCDQEGP